MSEFFKILKADPLGEPWHNSHTGKQNQTYWCQIEGQEKPLSLSKEVGNVPQPGTHIYGDLVYAKSQKGNEYFKFKSAKVPDGVQRPTDSVVSHTASSNGSPSQLPDVGQQIPGWAIPMINQINEIHKMLKAQQDPDATFKEVKAIMDEPLPEYKEEAPDPSVAFGE